MKLNGLLIEQSDTKDVIILDVPTFIRALEWAREDADLHVFAENAIELCKSKDSLSMLDYDALLKNTQKK
jgi:hypothetical protein